MKYILNWQEHEIRHEICTRCGQLFVGAANGILYTKQDARMTNLPGGNIQPCPSNR